MELDQLQAEWRERDQRLGQALRMNTELLRLSLLEQHRREIRRLGLWDKYEMIMGIPVFIFLVWFIGKYSAQLPFSAPAFVLLAWTITLPILSHRQRYSLQNLDFNQPIIRLQQQLAALKASRLRLLTWAFLLGQIVWFIPFLIVFFKGMFGVDLYRVSENFIVPSLIGGVLFIPLALTVAKILSPRLTKSSGFQRFTDMLAGKDLQTTRDFLQKLSGFEETPTDDSTH